MSEGTVTRDEQILCDTCHLPVTFVHYLCGPGGYRSKPMHQFCVEKLLQRCDEPKIPGGEGRWLP